MNDNYNWIAYNKEKTELVHAALKRWILLRLGDDPEVYLLTIRFPTHKPFESLLLAKKELRKVMRCYLRCLLPKSWHKMKWKFVAFAELGRNRLWHFHVIMHHKFMHCSEELVLLAFEKMVKQFDLDYCSLQLDPIDHTPEKVISYCLKEVRANAKGHFHTDRIIPSEDLFDYFNERELPAVKKKRFKAKPGAE